MRASSRWPRPSILLLFAAFAGCSSAGEGGEPSSEGASALATGERRYLIAGRGTALPSEAEILDAGGTPVGSIPSIGVAIATSSRPDFLRRIRRSASVASAAPDVELVLEDTAEDGTLDAGAETALDGLEAAAALPDDPFVVLQWPLAALHVPEAHARGLTGEGVTIALVDSGIDRLHPDLARAVLPEGKSFAPRPCAPGESPPCFADPFEVLSTHGTALAGIIGAECGNGIGICGVAPDAKLLSVKVFRNDGDDLPISRMLQAYDYASLAPGVRIVTSAVGNPACDDDDDECRDEVVRAFGIANRMLSLVHERGVTIFAAAGNDARNLTEAEASGLMHWPQLGAHVITVGSVGPCDAAGNGNVLDDNYDVFAIYSNYGLPEEDGRHFVMPGGQSPTRSTCTYARATCTVGGLTFPCRAFDQVPTTNRHDLVVGGIRGYRFSVGTSPATAHAAALAALALSYDPELDAGPLVDSIFEAWSRDLGPPGYDAFFGHGVGDAALLP